MNNELPNFMRADYSDIRFSKENELNENMSVNSSGYDELTRKLQRGE